MALLSLDEHLLTLHEAFDLVFCPCLIDTKKRDIEAMQDGEIAITLFNGGIRSSEDEEMARLLRQKSKLLIAFGSCACEGCVPGLANLAAAQECLDSSYLSCPTTKNEGAIVPRAETFVPEGTLELPQLCSRLRTLSDVVDVDYFIPGCPPESHRLLDVVRLITSGETLPPKGSILGAGISTVCIECPRCRGEKRLARFHRLHTLLPESGICLVDQGVVCMGLATRDGCGAKCPKAGMPCSGCYGAPEGVQDQGAKMVSALAPLIDIGDTESLGEDEIARRIDAALDTLPDPVGTFYKYSLAASVLKGTLREAD